MKIKELKDNEPLKVIEVSRCCKRSFNDPSLNPVIDEWKRIQMRIYTDGEIASEDEEISQKINEYYIGRRKYPYDVNRLKTKNVYFKNHSYVITYTIAEQFMTVGNIHGWFDVVKDVSVYLENSKDRRALKTAKQVIRGIENFNKSVDYSSIFTMYLSPKPIERFQSEKISKNVYCLRKVK